MIYPLLIIIGLSIYEIRNMSKKSLKKEMLVYTLFALLTLALGFYTILFPYKISFSQQVLKIIGKEF